MRLGLLGLGNLGSAVAYIAAKNGHEVLAWEFDKLVVEEVNNLQVNERYLSGFTFPETVVATSNVMDVVKKIDFLVITLPSRFIESVLQGMAIPIDLPIVNMSKGLDPHTKETTVKLLERLLPDNPMAMLAGPSIANEFVNGVVTGMVAASADAALQAKISQVFNSSTLSIQYSQDVMGTELGGILKNIYALGLGITDKNKSAGMNFQGAYLTLALKEMSDFSMAYGASESAFQQISGLGDLITTALSEHSHNRKMGKLIAQNLTIEEIAERMTVLPEGYNSLPVILAMADEKSLELPLACMIRDLVERSMTVGDFFIAFSALLKEK